MQHGKILISESEQLNPICLLTSLVWTGNLVLCDKSFKVNSVRHEDTDT